MTAVRSDQRYTRGRRCPICGGAEGDPRGKGARCTGYLSSCGTFAHCSREEHAGAIERTESSETFAHILEGPCRCGVTHRERERDHELWYDSGRNVRPEALFSYRDERGKLLYQVARLAPLSEKRFRQRRPDTGTDGATGFRWKYKLEDTRRVLYRLPELLAADPSKPIYIVEGEKDVETLRARGYVATTNPQGAKQWSTVHETARTVLAGRHVVLLLDADTPGRERAAQVRASIAPVVASLRVIDLHPDREDGADVSDWFAAGGTAEKLEELRAAAAEEDLAAWRTHAQDAEDTTPDDGAPNAPGAPGPAPRKISQATLLVTIARQRAEFWRTPDGDLFASVEIDGHREHLRLASKQFRQWLAHVALTMMGRAASAGTIRDATGALEGVARYEGAEHRTFTRIAAVDDRVYIDLCDTHWRAVEIDRDGWRIVERSPVRFERRNAMAPLPDPVRGGSIRELREHVRIADDSWPLVVGWLVGALAPHGPYPALVFRAQHGAGKSCGARTLRSLVDPSIAPIRSEPREPRDLVISARASHVIALDNLSSVPPWLSDGLCRLATGGGYAARALYTDTDEIVIDVQRPVILTGITDVVTAPDLLDRSLLVELKGIAPAARETERRLEQRWRSAHPRILGALYNAVSAALARRDTIRPKELPRLADWATWATAAEPALGLADGAVIAALKGQAEEAVEIAIDASIIARPICNWIAKEPAWTGTADALRIVLTNRVDAPTERDKSWPRTARAMAAALAKIAPALQGRGVRVERLRRGHGGVREWSIERMDGGAS